MIEKISYQNCLRAVQYLVSKKIYFDQEDRFQEQNILNHFLPRITNAKNHFLRGFSTKQNLEGILHAWMKPEDESTIFISDFEAENVSIFSILLNELLMWLDRSEEPNIIWFKSFCFQREGVNMLDKSFYHTYPNNSIRSYKFIMSLNPTSVRNHTTYHTRLEHEFDVKSIKYIQVKKKGRFYDLTNAIASQSIDFRKVYKFYASASVHTSQENKLPFKLFYADQLAALNNNSNCSQLYIEDDEIKGLLIANKRRNIVDIPFISTTQSRLGHQLFYNSVSNSGVNEALCSFMNSSNTVVLNNIKLLSSLGRTVTFNYPTYKS